MTTTHRQCRDAECNICRGDTHVIGPSPDTLCRDCGAELAPAEVCFWEQRPLEVRRCGLCQLDELTL